MSRPLSFIIAGFVAGVLITLWFTYKEPGPVPGIGNIQTATTSTVTLKVPVTVQDKKELQQIGAISKKTAQAPDKEVIAASKKKDQTGTTYTAAVLNTDTGQSEIVTQRPTAEWMNSNELAGGITAGSLGAGYELQYRRSIGRVWSVYGELDVTVWKWVEGTRLSQGHRYDGQLSFLVRFPF